MGKKNKRQQQDSDDDYTAQGTTGNKAYVSAKQAAKLEAAEAEKGGAGMTKKQKKQMVESDSDEDG